MSGSRPAQGGCVAPLQIPWIARRTRLQLIGQAIWVR